LPQETEYIAKNISSHMSEVLKLMLAETDGFIGYSVAEVETHVQLPLHVINKSFQERNKTQSGEWNLKILQLLEGVVKNKHYSTFERYLSDLNIIKYEYLLHARGPEKYPMLNEFLKTRQPQQFSKQPNYQSLYDQFIVKEIEALTQLVMFHHEKASFDICLAENQVFLALFDEIRTITQEHSGEIRSKYEQLQFDEEKLCKGDPNISERVEAINKKLYDLLAVDEDKIRMLSQKIAALTELTELKSKKIQSVATPSDYQVNISPEAKSALMGITTQSNPDVEVANALRQACLGLCKTTPRRMSSAGINDSSSFS